LPDEALVAQRFDASTDRPSGRIKILSSSHALRVSDANFDDEMRRLVAAIESLSEKAQFERRSTSPEQERLTRLDKDTLHSGELLELVAAQAEQRQSLRRLRNLEELYLHGNSRLDLPTEILGSDFKAVQGKRMRLARPDDILT
jgi:hypothetical protein